MIYMLKIAVIGGRETVMGFTALGLEAYPVADAAEAKSVLRSLTREREDVAIIYIEENLAAELGFHALDAPRECRLRDVEFAGCLGKCVGLRGDGDLA